MLNQLLCPKCHNIMSRYERNGVQVDHCDGCGGLFLDRGELEHLVQAEAAHYGQVQVGAMAGHRFDQDDERYRRHPRRKKSRGFLEDLLDF